MSHFELPAFGRTGAMPPTLLMHDRDDRSTPAGQSSAIADGWPGSQLHLTVGLGHNRLLRDPDVVARAVDFVTSTSRHDPDGSHELTLTRLDGARTSRHDPDGATNSR
jgi:hypothetical protein